jgi:hypothetical protein
MTPWLLWIPESGMLTVVSLLGNPSPPRSKLVIPLGRKRRSSGQGA